MKDLGELKYLLGAKVERNLEGMRITQCKYVVDFIKMFGLVRCKPTPTPMTRTRKIIANDGIPMKNPKKNYRSLMVALQCLTFTCLNISFTVNQVC